MRIVPSTHIGAAAWLGILSGTFSTAVVSLGAARIGRDCGVEWMTMASLVFGDSAWEMVADPVVIAVGMLVHLAIEVAWALVFFVGLGRWTARTTPARLLAVTPFWALATSALEWFVIVPLALHRTVFTLEQPYWLGFAVHLVSTSFYPVFPALRDALAQRSPSPHRRFAAAWGASLLAFAVLLGVAAVLGRQGRELPHLGGDIAWDRTFMRRMGAHHEQGLVLARLAQREARDPHVRGLVRLMLASQHAEVRALERWWRSWFDDAPALVCSEAEKAAMPGMLTADELTALGAVRGRSFDAAFVQAMSKHHRGAVAMADEALGRASDPRLRLMSHSIRHEQRGEIVMMQRIEGAAAVRLGVRAMHAPLGAHPADTP
jgi:uncharacterized protein (DUF305 family)